MRPSRLHRFLDATSQQWNVLIFDGEANHSVSGDAYRFGRARLMSLIDWIFLAATGEIDHCRRSHEADIQRACALCARKGET